MSHQPQLDPSSAYYVQQQAQRIASLEDLLRRNESSLSAVLGRVRDIELAVNNFNRTLAKLTPDVSLVVEDLNATKRKLDLVDNAWRSTVKDFESVVVNEIRNNKPIPLGNDPLFQRVSQEIQQQHNDIHETSSMVRRLMDTSNADGKTLKQVESDSKWLTEQLREVAASQRDFTSQQQRRNEQVSTAVQETRQEQERGLNQIRGVIEAVSKSTRDELVVRVENESRARLGLQNDFVTSFSKMREDVMKGFAQTATNLRNVDETTSSLETVLRAEVRSRMTKMEELNRRSDIVEERLRREALSAAEYLKALDNQLGSAIREVRDATAAECKGQLEEIWREVGDLKQRSVAARGRGAGSPPARGRGGPAAASATPAVVVDEGEEQNELSHQRSRLRLETELSKHKEEILATVDKRLKSTTALIENYATKQELTDATEVLSMKMDAKLKHDVRPPSTPEPSTGTAGSNAVSKARVRQLEGRIDHTEKQVSAVSDAVKEVHDDLVEKVSGMEKHMAALDGIQKKLQQNFERDHEQMQEYLQNIREQIVNMLDDSESPAQSPKKKPPPERVEGKDPDTTFQMDDTASTQEEPPSPSNRAMASYHILDDQIKLLNKVTRNLEQELQREHSDLKAALEQQSEHVKKLHKRQEEDGSRLKSEFESFRRKQGEDISTVTDRLEEHTEVTADQLAKLSDEIRIVRLEASGGVSTRPEEPSSSELKKRVSSVEAAFEAMKAEVATKSVVESMMADQFHDQVIPTIRNEIANLERTLKPEVVESSQQTMAPEPVAEEKSSAAAEEKPSDEGQPGYVPVEQKLEVTATDEGNTNEPSTGEAKLDVAQTEDSKDPKPAEEARPQTDAENDGK